MSERCTHIIIEPHDNGTSSVFAARNVELGHEFGGGVIADVIPVVRDSVPVDIMSEEVPEGRGFWPVGSYSALIPLKHGV